MKAIFTFLIWVVSFNFALAQDGEYNCDDPKCQSEQARLANPQVMNAQFLSRGIPCETGACFKDADAGLGFDLTPAFNPDGTPTDPSRRVSPGESVK